MEPSNSLSADNASNVKKPTVLLSVYGHPINEDPMHWNVYCPICEEEFEHKGFFNSQDVTICKCGCKFTTKLILE